MSNYGAINADKVEGSLVGQPVPRVLTFTAACLTVMFASGGVVVITGPLDTALVTEGYVSAGELSTIAIGALQLLILGIVVGSLICSKYGPRTTAIIGAVWIIIGYVSLASVSAPCNPYVIMVLFGLLGFGGNHIFVSCFQFGSLFPGKIGVCDGILEGCFEFCAYILFLLNIPSATLSSFSWSMACVVSFFVLPLLVVFYPDTAYQFGNTSQITYPSTLHYKELCDFSDHLGIWKECCSLRTLLFIFFFAWTTLMSSFVSSVIADVFPESVMGEAFYNWVFTIVGNSTFVFTPFVGWLMDRTGYGYLAIACIVFAQIDVLMIFVAEPIGAYSALIFLNLTKAIQYPMVFRFLFDTLPPESFPSAFIFVSFWQFLFGLIAYVILPNPWGDNYIPVALIMIIPAFLCFVFPWYELIEKRRGLISAYLEEQTKHTEKEQWVIET